jgi:hypothetical protein
MTTRDCHGAVGSNVPELQERVRLLTTRRADLAWRALLDQVHARNAVVVQTLLAACRDSTLRRLVASGNPPVSTSQAGEEACVGELSTQLVLLTLRRHLGDRRISSAAETDFPSASERFGISELRRHRAEIRKIFQGVKVELWTSVVQAALLEAGALVVRVEARCSEAEIGSLRRHLSEALEQRPSPLGTPGAELQQVAEYVALEQVLASLDRRRHRDRAVGHRPRPAGGYRDVSPTGFEPVSLA